MGDWFSMPCLLGLYKVKSKQWTQRTYNNQHVRSPVSYWVLTQQYNIWHSIGRCLKQCLYDIQSVPLLAPSPSLVGPVGRLTLWDDFASDSAPSSVLHGASPSAPTHITKSTRCAIVILQHKCNIICVLIFRCLQLSFPLQTSRCHCHENDCHNFWLTKTALDCKC